MGLRGGMDSSILSRLPGGPRGDVRLPRTLMKTLKKGERIISLNIDVEIQIKPGHDKAASCFSYISPSTLWISDKFGTYRKVYSRRIQCRRFRSLDSPPTHQVFSLNYHLFLARFGVFWRL